MGARLLSHCAVPPNALEGVQLLALWCARQCLTYRRERCVLRHLAQAEEVGRVFPQEIGDSLDFGLLPYPYLLFPVLSYLHRHLPNMHVY